MNREKESVREEIARFMRRLYGRGLTTASGGNISVRTDGGIYLTPGGSDKGCVTGAEIGKIDFDGNVLTPGFHPSCEAGMHLAVYRARPDVNAIVHAHPVIASAFAAASCPISSKLLSESYSVLGEIGRIGFFPSGTEELARAAADIAKVRSAVILANHGAMTFGRTLLQAFDRLEVLENAAKATLVCEHLLKGGASPIPEAGLALLTVMK